MRKRKPIIILLIIDILAIVLIVCNVKFGIFNKMATAISKVLHPESENSFTPKDKPKPSPLNPDSDDDEPDNPDDPVIVIRYPLEISFDTMGGTATGETSFYLDGTEKTIDDLVYPEVDYLEYEFVEWGKEEYAKIVEDNVVYVWEFYAIWEYSPYEYYTRILSSSAFTLNDSTYYLDVDKEVESVSVLSNFKYRNNVATAKLYSDSACTSEITTDDVAINPGYNECWLKIDAGVHGSEIWRLEIYRTREYSVSFTVSGVLDTIEGLENFIVKEKDRATLNRITPLFNKPGYTYTPSISLNTVIDHDLEVNIDTSYTDFSISYADTKGAINTNTTHYDIRDEVTFTPIEKFGYIFNGWTLNGEPITKIDVGSYGDLTISADWTIITWNVAYDLDGGEAEPMAEAYSVEEGVVLNNPIKKGYIFKEWQIYDVDDNLLPYDPAFTYYKDVKVVATYTKALASAFYGKYPQELVTDPTIISQLDSISPVDGIYKLDGNEYIKEAANAFLDGLKFRDGTTIVNGTEYYFKLCPVEWIELYSNDNEYTIMSKYVLDASIFDENVNNYIYAQIFATVNDMVDVMFGEEEKLNLIQYVIDNSYATVNQEEQYFVEPEEGMWRFESAEGFITIPSFYEVSTYLTETDTLVTDYAIAKGCLFNPVNYKAFYYYRSPYAETRDKYVSGYNASGEGSDYESLSITTTYGIRVIVCVESGDKTE